MSFLCLKVLISMKYLIKTIMCKEFMTLTAEEGFPGAAVCLHLDAATTSTHWYRPSTCLTLVDAIDVEMQCSTGFAHQPYVISFLKKDEHRWWRTWCHIYCHSRWQNDSCLWVFKFKCVWSQTWSSSRLNSQYSLRVPFPLVNIPQPLIMIVPNKKDINFTMSTSFV